jgi:hypothetical protein
MSMPQVSGLERVIEFATDSSDASGDEGGFMPPQVRNMYHHSPEIMAATLSQAPYAQSVLSFHGSPSSVHSEPYPILDHGVTSNPMVTSAASYQSSYPAHLPSNHSIHIVDSSPDAWPREEIASSHIQDVMGELKIDTNALGNSKKLLKRFN